MEQRSSPPAAAFTESVDAPTWAIRAEQPTDLDQINDLHRAAFPTSAEAEMVDAVRASAGFIPELSLVAATADGSILGHVMISVVSLEHGETSTPVLALAPLAVLPPHRGRGIGDALTQAVLAMADERDEPFVVVLGGADYARYGFERASAFDVTGPYDVPDEAYQLRPRPGAEEIPAGRVAYPASFAGV